MERRRKENEWSLTREGFDLLLSWLDADRERGAFKYEEIRRRLVKLFVGRGYAAAEDLADETINRVMRNLPELASNYEGDPGLYFYGVAHNVHREQSRRRLVSIADEPSLRARPEDSGSGEDEAECEQEKGCLRRCLKLLTPNNRKVVLEYYRVSGVGQDGRALLAARLGVTTNALRIRVHRVKAGLQTCILNCIDRS